ncbi:hypothetical protein HMF7854_05400 [Sphingomonas ginkgonis]|uniref:17 kDa surface antigen n=1 Tax=Sphingomonas ginkgonis TaxID=2315330 RepID=A0A429V8M5_9SPHN|nr:hypothetical protein [Sphingomonas ginkgonis]RST30320.1 hypothetical protein HMF7854_05400 [Sphingomonas ginkgonis]
MKSFRKALAMSAGAALAAAALATPAAAQYGNPYGGYGGYGGWGGYSYGAGPATLIGNVLDSILRGTYAATNGYNYGPERWASDQCARAVEARLNNYGGYGGYGYGPRARVVSFDKIERRGDGLKIWGWATTSRPGYGGGGYYGNWGGWNGAYSRDVRIACKIDRYGRVFDTDIKRGRW